MTTHALTDEELAWQIARQMEEEEREQERRDEEMARSLNAHFTEEHLAHHSLNTVSAPNSIVMQPPSPPRRVYESPPVKPYYPPYEPPKSNTIDCPICSKPYPVEAISDHVEECLSVAPQEDELRRSKGIKIEHHGEYDPVTLETFECPICLDDVEPGAGYRFQQCKHTYCGVCLEAYYQELINKREVEGIVCPDPKCGSKVTSFDLEYILNPEMYAKYQLFVRNAKIDKDPTMKWCPNPGCENAVKRKDPQNQLMVCEECDTEFCYSCGGKFHPGKKCEDATKFSLFGESWRVKVWKSFNTKPCPKCNAPIAKSSGCNHMTCGSCKHEFCWLCKKPFSWGHWSDSACTMYGSSFNIIGMAKRVVRLPQLIRERMEANDDDDDD